MRIHKIFNFTAGLLSLIFLLSFPVTVQAGKFKVLVVMSYEKENPWCKEIKEGIDLALNGIAAITYFYMDTKINLEGGEQKAKEANALMQQIHPDGIITADDNAQQLFVLPYLKDKSTPVMFCGLNAEPDKYGYPAKNISGILERGHIRESLAFAKQLSPSLKTIGVLARDNPSGNALQKQIESEADTYVAQIASIKLAKNINEVQAFGEEQSKYSDAIFTDSLAGIVDDTGVPLSINEIIEKLVHVYNKPIIGSNLYHVKQWALCAVVKTGQEQGSTAAYMLLEAMRGKPVTEIPIRKNYKGKRVINVSVMKKLGINPRPIVLLGADLVTNGE